jgi:hypothetical protein
MKTIAIRSFDNYILANMLLMRLQDAGLDCWLNDEFTVTIDPLLGNAIGGIKLVVWEKDIDFALRLTEAAEEEYRNNAVCGRCGEPGLLYIDTPRSKTIVTTLLSWLMTSYALPTEKVYHCKHCGWESKTLPDLPMEELPEEDDTNPSKSSNLHL